MLTVISLGAGVQSTTMALMAAHGEITPMPDCAIFADVQAEPKAVYDHLAWLMSGNVLPFPVHIVTKGSLRDGLFDQMGHDSEARPPFFNITDRGGAGQIQRRCTQHYKIEPIHQKLRELVGLKARQRAPKTPVVEQWIGISTDEAMRIKPSRDSYIANRWPLIEHRMHRRDCIKWMEQHGYPKPPKSACTFCPYRPDTGWRDMKDNDPASWADAVAVDRHIRHDMPHIKGPVFIHRSLQPLDEVDLSTAEENGQLNLFNDECEGMCGV